EIGVIQDMDAVAEIVRACAPQAILHSDAVQAAPWCELGPVTEVVDLMSISAHKFGGPNGVGVLVQRKGTVLTAQQTGGGQEQERRGGTQNVAGIVGMAEALNITVRQREVEINRVRSLRDRLTSEILSGTSGVSCTVPQELGLPNISHLLLHEVESEVLLVLLEREGVMASAASSCASGAVGQSHVLAALGDRAAESRGAIRLSLGWSTTEEDVERGVAGFLSSIKLASERPT
ncbi:MAG: cysteine desulfurase family protein, partial [Acidimicrobiales bacterium]